MGAPKHSSSLLSRGIPFNLSIYNIIVQTFYIAHEIHSAPPGGKTEISWHCYEAKWPQGFLCCQKPLAVDFHLEKEQLDIMTFRIGLTFLSWEYVFDIELQAGSHRSLSTHFGILSFRCCRRHPERIRSAAVE